MTHWAPWTLWILYGTYPGHAQVLFGLENRVPVDIWGSVTDYSVDPCLSQRVPHSECPIGLPGPCGPCANLILGPRRPYFVKKTGFWVNILGSVAHYSVEPCLLQQVPQTE